MVGCPVPTSIAIEPDQEKSLRGGSLLGHLTCGQYNSMQQIRIAKQRAVGLFETISQEKYNCCCRKMTKRQDTEANCIENGSNTVNEWMASQSMAAIDIKENYVRFFNINDGLYSACPLLLVVSSRIILCGLINPCFRVIPIFWLFTLSAASLILLPVDRHLF